MTVMQCIGFIPLAHMISSKLHAQNPLSSHWTHGHYTSLLVVVASFPCITNIASTEHCSPPTLPPEHLHRLPEQGSKLLEFITSQLEVPSLSRDSELNGLYKIRSARISAFLR